MNNVLFNLKYCGYDSIHLEEFLIDYIHAYSPKVHILTGHIEKALMFDANSDANHVVLSKVYIVELLDIIGSNNWLDGIPDSCSLLNVCDLCVLYEGDKVPVLNNLLVTRADGLVEDIKNKNYHNWISIILIDKVD